jgi:hypothetical protein
VYMFSYATRVADVVVSVYVSKCVYVCICHTGGSMEETDVRG